MITWKSHCPPGIRRLVWSPPLASGWKLWFASNQCNVIKMVACIWLHYTDSNVYLARKFFSLFLFEKSSAYVREVCVARNSRESPANSQQETEALNPVWHNELSSSTSPCTWNWINSHILQSQLTFLSDLEAEGHGTWLSHARRLTQKLRNNAYIYCFEY